MSFVRKNTIVEETVEEVKTEHALTTAFEVPRKIAEVDLTELPRFATGFGELDRVLGGGLISGSIILWQWNYRAGGNSQRVR